MASPSVKTTDQLLALQANQLAAQAKELARLRDELGRQRRISSRNLRNERTNARRHRAVIEKQMEAVRTLLLSFMRSHSDFIDKLTDTTPTLQQAKDFFFSNRT